MKRILIYLSTLLVILASCKKDDIGKSCLADLNAESLIHNSETREYVLYIPNSYSGNSAVPIFFNFHGFGGNALEFMDYADMRPIAESDTFIIVYPQGTCLDGFPHWNASLLGGDNKSSADDFGFFETMLSEISADYNVDAERIYACGYSNGGMFAYGLANFKSDLIAAVGSVSGTMLDFDGSTSHPMPVIHLHGTEDNVIPYTGNGGFNSTQSVLDHWVNFNNTITSPIVNTESNGSVIIEHSLYNQGNNDVSVEHYKYIGADHVWFNETYQNKNTAQLIWGFVSKYDIHGLR